VRLAGKNSIYGNFAKLRRKNEMQKKSRTCLALLTGRF
jgi:hypothetical protein